MDVADELQMKGVGNYAATLLGTIEHLRDVAAHKGYAFCRINATRGAGREGRGATRLG